MEQDLAADHGSTCLSGGQDSRCSIGVPPHTIPLYGPAVTRAISNPGMVGKIPIRVVKLAGILPMENLSSRVSRWPNIWHYTGPMQFTNTRDILLAGNRGGKAGEGFEMVREVMLRFGSWNVSNLTGKSGGGGGTGMQIKG